MVVGNRKNRNPGAPRRPPVLLVYQLDVLLSESADDDISPSRVFETTEGELASLHLNKSSVSMAVRDGEDCVKLTKLDFWNCQEN